MSRNLSSSVSHLLPRIGIDLLGSDVESGVLLESLLPIMKTFHSRARFFLFGEESNRSILASLPSTSYEIAKETVFMTDDPLYAVRKKPESSLILGLQSLKKNNIDAFISLGNTGALTAGAHILLKQLPHISRPALLARIPSTSHDVALLDVGANVSCQPSHFIEMAAMGVAYQKMHGIHQPKIGLLNIGTESTKGPSLLQEAFKTLSLINDRTNYRVFCGNIEPREVFTGAVDVVISDGFTGNVFLKTCEGMALFLLKHLSDAPSAGSIKKRLAAIESAGAPLCGVPGVIVKCHGRGDSQTFSCCIEHALSLIQENYAFSDAIHKEIRTFLAVC